MGIRSSRVGWLATCVFTLTLTIAANAQVARPLITNPIDESQMVRLRGNTHPLAQPQFDLGVAPPDLPLNRMLLVLKRSPQQDFALTKLLDDQQDKNSPNYHRWLTPDQFGQQFGSTDQDLQIVTGWLQSHGLQISRVSHGRGVIEFSGLEAQVESAFHTQIHQYLVNGQQHWANASDPQIPAALAPAVAGVQALNNFPAKWFVHSSGVVVRSKSTGQVTSANPDFTLGGNCGVQNNCYAVGPYDFATIYDMTSSWNASPAIDGTGQTIAIVGETDINPQDVADFRNFFGLPAYGQAGGPNLNVIHNGPAPGILTDGEETESDLDVEWSGAVAKGANVDFVVSESTETTQGIHLSALYIIDNNLAPIMSESYGTCELFVGTAGNQFFNALWQQAAAQGITVMISAGDGGSAGCDDFNLPGPATHGLQISGYASTPYNVAVGGTDFYDWTSASQYWSFTNTATTQASALSYIPETTWDDNCTNPVFGQLLGFSNNAEANCNNLRLIQAGFVNIVGGSGGKSNCISSNGANPSSCTGGYPKPSWQNAPGVPADGVRDIPDVSLFAASGSPSGSFYVVCEADAVGGSTSCNPNDPFTAFLGIGGTSASSPAFAGIMALVDQATKSPQGNANFVLYKLAQNYPSSFHDVTNGTIAVPCQTGSLNCTTATAGDQYGVLSGYSTGPGYDLATGIGSVDVANLLSNWAKATFTATTTTLALSPTTNLTHGQAVSVTASVKPSSGSGTPTGAVSLLTSTGVSVDGFTLSNGAISGNTNLLPGGTYTVTAHYGGDATFGSSISTPVNVTVGKENSSAQLQLLTFDWNGNLLSNNATTAMYGSPYILRVNVLNSQGVLCQPDPLGEAGCPTGNVSLTDNTSPLDGGTFPLNSEGYTEDQTVQLSGGNNSVKAQYAGDNSFNASSATTAYSITLAPTGTSIPTLNGTASVGGQAFFSTTVQSSPTFGVAPTGTVSFTVNGAPLSGSTSLSPQQSGNPNDNYVASSQGQILTSTSPFPQPGTYMVAASYSGDTNYQSSVSSTASILVQFPQPSVMVQASATSVNAGSNVTLTATVTGASKTIAPTGTITFVGSQGGPTGTVSYSTVTDSSSGNLDLQGSLTFAPTINNESYSAQYNGDSNYPAQPFSNFVQIGVNGSDFSITSAQSSVTVVPGGSVAATVVVALQATTSPINFSATACTGLPKETTCSISPNPAPQSGNVNVLLTTMAPHFASRVVARSDRLHEFPFAVLPFAAILLVSAPRRARRKINLCCMGILVALLLGCGGGGGGGGGGNTDPGTPPGSYTITVTGTSGSYTHSTSFTLVVQ